VHKAAVIDWKYQKTMMRIPRFFLLLLLLPFVLGFSGCKTSDPNGSAANSSNIVANTTGATMFANSCQIDSARDVFACHPLKLSWGGQDPRGFSSHSLGEFELQVNLSEPASFEPTLKSSAVDLSSQRVFWHGGCSSEYFVTDMVSGHTQRFPIDPTRIGLPDASRGVCLAELVFDPASGVAVALGGRTVDQPSGTSVEPSDDYSSIYGNLAYLLARRAGQAGLRTFLTKWPVDRGSLGSINLGSDPGPKWFNMDWSRAWAFGALASQLSATNPVLARSLAQARAVAVADGTDLYRDRMHDRGYAEWVPQFAVFALTEESH
jgi:hypothetical protein